jgi:scyllo-inositol 2-dehydrogenase (NADP+)
VAEVRVALIGFGLAGRVFHAPLIDATEGLTLASVVTANPQRAEQVARDHPFARVLASAGELWERGGHELVVIAAPNAAHAPLAIEALERGHAVVVDKPLAVTAAEAQGVVERAERKGLLLTVFQNRRWDSDHLTLVKLIAERRLGEVFRYESRFERWRPSIRADAWRETLAPERGGGQLLDLGSHLVDQALALFGPVAELYGEIDARRRQAADDDAFLALRHESGVISHLHASATTAAPGPRLRVLGSEAGFVVEKLDSQEDALRAGLRPDDPGRQWGVEPPSHWGRLTAGERSEPIASERGGWPRFYELLRDALGSDGPPPVDPWDAVAALRVLDQARAA